MWDHHTLEIETVPPIKVQYPLLIVFENSEITTFERRTLVTRIHQEEGAGILSNAKLLIIGFTRSAANSTFMRVQ